MGNCRIWIPGRDVTRVFLWEKWSNGSIIAVPAQEQKHRFNNSDKGLIKINGSINFIKTQKIAVVLQSFVSGQHMVHGPDDPGAQVGHEDSDTVPDQIYLNSSRANSTWGQSSREPTTLRNDQTLGLGGVASSVPANV